MRLLDLMRSNRIGASFRWLVSALVSISFVSRSSYLATMDDEGNTPLHEIFPTDVKEELLRLGADVNARNNDGETPIFTNVSNDAISLFIQHGADLTIRNNDGKTVFEAAKEKGAAREEALRKAVQKLIKP
jgi:ankyrin repeat protein